MGLPATSEAEWAALLLDQDGVVSRRQALSLGWTTDQIQRHRRSGRWVRLHPGIYSTFTGPVPWSSTVWAALLHAGPDALASHRTAGRLQGLVDDEPEVVEVLVPWGRRVTRRPGLVVRSTRSLPARRHPARRPPQTRVEETVLDLVEASTGADDVVGWLTKASQRRLTTPDRLMAASRHRPRLRHRVLVLDTIAEVREGVASPLESRYRGLERAHGLPQALRGERITIGGRHWYADVRYADFRTRIELEGLRWHRPEDRWRDSLRDNAGVVHGDAVLRYDWRAVAGRPCATAAEVAVVLRSRGWADRAHPCSATCCMKSR
jgi:hypothetical protein